MSTFCRGPPMIQSMEGSLGVRKGAWTEEEDILLRQCVEKHGEGKWCQIPLRAGLNRCRKSCRLRWLNYLKPNIKRGGFTGDEVDLLIRLHKLLGNRWSLIAGRLPGRTANDVKNYWNTHLRKKANSCDKDAKEKAEDIVKVNVIKPRPRTFTKSLTCLSGKPAVVKSFEPKDNVSSISPALMASDSRVKWWESLLDDKEGDEGATCATSALDKEPNTDLWAEKIAPEAKRGDSFDVDGTSCLADFSFDDDGTSFFADFSFETSLWKFLNAD